MGHLLLNFFFIGYVVLQTITPRYRNKFIQNLHIGNSVAVTRLMKIPKILKIFSAPNNHLAPNPDSFSLAYSIQETSLDNATLGNPLHTMHPKQCKGDAVCACARWKRPAGDLQRPLTPAKFGQGLLPRHWALLICVVIEYMCDVENRHALYRVDKLIRCFSVATVEMWVWKSKKITKYGLAYRFEINRVLTMHSSNLGTIERKSLSILECNSIDRIFTVDNLRVLGGLYFP